MSDAFTASFIPLLTVSLAAVLIEALFPEDGSPGLAGALRLITGLCVLLTLLAPLRAGTRFLRTIAEGDPEAAADWLESYGRDIAGAGVIDPDRGLDNMIASSGADGIASWVMEQMNERFGIPPSSCRVIVDADFSSGSGSDAAFCVRSVSIVLSGEAILKNPHLIEEWIGGQLGCECRVAVG